MVQVFDGRHDHACCLQQAVLQVHCFGLQVFFYFLMGESLSATGLHGKALQFCRACPLHTTVPNAEAPVCGP